MDFDSIFSQLKAQAIQIYEHNWYEDDRFAFHQPSANNYCSFFAWDSGWNIIAGTHLNPEKAFRELETVFKMQIEAKYIPHETRIPVLEKNEEFFRSLFIKMVIGQYDSNHQSHFIDPPSYLLAAEVLYNKTKDRRVLSLLPKMESTLKYLIHNRDLFGDGLISIIHPWESGTDASPVFDETIGLDPSKPLWMVRFGLEYIKMVKKLTRLKWDLTKIKTSQFFAFEDVGVNGIAIAGMQSISNLYSAQGNTEKASFWLNEAKKRTLIMEKFLWNESKGFFYPRWDLTRPHQVLRTCTSGFVPLITGLVDPKKSERIFNDYLLSPQHFANEWMIPYNSKLENDPEKIPFHNPVLWRGPCIWMNMNWLTARAADRCGRRDIAREITEKSIKMIQKSGFREYYNPTNGEGGGAINFTWPALILDMIDTYCK